MKNFTDMVNNRLKLNISGNIFEVPCEILKRLPFSRLALVSSAKLHSDVEIFYNRNPAFFPFVLDVYRSGLLHLPR